MGKLIDAIQADDKFTENGMITNSTSLNACVDMFSRIGAMRNESNNTVINLFVKAIEEDALVALKLLFWARDVRGGAGERKIFRTIISYLAENRPEVLKKNINIISEFGRWDDLFSLIGTPVEAEALTVIESGLRNKNGLLAKWLPRPNVSNAVKKNQAKIVRNKLKLSPKYYRKLLVELSNTVEQKMCANKWNEIKYEHVPSKAMSDYMKTFGRHDHAGFTEYLNSVQKGESKINAGAVYPYDIIKNLNNGDSNGASLQWNALPNYLEDNQERLLPLVDVSGSMSCSAGDSKNLTCLDVAISLGLYISERNVGVFKDAFITFSSSPELIITKGSLKDRYRQMSTSNWCMSTNLQAAYSLILRKAIANKVPQSEMPTTILILSDMQFNSATSWSNKAQKMVKEMFSEAGYELPKIVYWNLNARNQDSPVKFDENGTGLVSGFSPSLLKTILSGKNITPYDMMMDTISVPRYDVVTV